MSPISARKIMMSETKVQFSKDELNLLKNSAWILTKNAVIQKVSVGFGELAAAMEEIIASSQPVYKTLIQRVPAKISKGENYHGLPYLMLDYPRVFSRENVLAVRTFCWWGHHFSITLHVKGQFVDSVAPKIIQHMPMLRKENYLLATSGDEWVHDLTAKPHYPIDRLNEAKPGMLKGGEFIRLGKIVPLLPWPEARAALWRSFKELCPMF